jgi:peptidylprolyl isomerase
MKKVETGDFVKLCYTGMLDNGMIFDKTEKCKPLEVQVGSGGLVEGFESAIVGMGQNEKKSFVLEPDEAYGERDERLERTFLRSSLPLSFEPFPGQVIVFMTENKRELPAIVKSVDDELLVVDFNHPLAGRSLLFEVEVAQIADTESDYTAECEAECCCAA